MQAYESVERRAQHGDRDPLLFAAQRVLQELLVGHNADTLAASAHWPMGLRQQLRTLADTARLDSVPVERLIVSIKRAWRTVPRARMTLGDEAGEVLTTIVTVCIEEYFADAERTVLT